MQPKKDWQKVKQQSPEIIKNQPIIEENLSGILKTIGASDKTPQEHKENFINKFANQKQQDTNSNIEQNQNVEISGDTAPEDL